jgi:hypothetical protein
MKVLVVLGAIMFSGGAAVFAYYLVKEICYKGESYSEGITIGIALMVMPLVALLAGKLIKKL